MQGATGNIDLGALWGRVVEATGKGSPFIKTYLLESHPISIEKNLLTIGFDPECSDYLTLVDNPKVHTLLQAKLQEQGYEGMRIRFIEGPRPQGFTLPVSSAPESSGGPAAASGSAKPEDYVYDKEAFKNDPLIKSALDIFKGEIVEIRK